MIVLTEYNETNLLIESAKDGKKNYFIEGVFIQSEIVNRNHRIYPKAVIKPEVDRYIKEMINDNRAVGELGHPTSPTINYDRASHKILSLTENGNNWIGRA